MPESVAHEYAVANLGLISTAEQDGHEYAVANVGLANTFDDLAHEYSNINIVSTPPSPYVFGTRPTRARTGDSVTVIATGAGSTKPTYLGALQVQNDDGSWSEVPTTRWQQIAATSDAYNSFRTVTDDMETVDVEHIEIDIVVPNSATPPNLPIRIVTNTP